MTEDDLKAIESRLHESYRVHQYDDSEVAEWVDADIDLRPDDVLALIAEVQHLHSCIWAVYIAGYEKHKDGDGKMIDPVEFVNKMRVAKANFRATGNVNVSPEDFSDHTKY